MTDFLDDFNGTSLNSVWGCEFQCPTVSGGYARCSLLPNYPPNQNQTWSKLVYKNQTFGYGTYSMTFRYSRRPTETQTWAGLALWDNNASDSSANEINFGIDTACISRCSDTTLILESYKNGKNSEIICQTGVNLFDGSWHTGTIIFTATSIALIFDGAQIGLITDISMIPTVQMSFIPGARIISGQLNSEFHMDIDKIAISTSTSLTKYKCSGTSCVEDNVNGIYTSCTPNPCTVNGPCGQPTCYKCANNICTQDNANGIYASSNCDNACVNPNTYGCVGSTCIEGTGNLPVGCNNTCGTGNGPCGQPTCYKCDGTTCTQDNANGIYTSSNCNNICSSNGGGDYWLQKTTCVKNKYIAIGAGTLVGIIVLALIFKK